MLELSSPPEDDRLPEAPGSFCWWYVDLVDQNGDGAVLIWGFGLPFLEPPVELPGRSRPFVNLAVYVQGRCTAYWLVEVPEADVQALPGGWRIGGSQFQTSRGERVTVDARLDLPVPGGAPVRARLSVEGAPARGAPAPQGPHRWSPVIGAGAGRLEIDGKETIAGRAYHDRNVSDVPLATLGIREWAWGRVAEPGRDRVHYVLWPESGEPKVLAVRLDEDGTVTWEESTVEQAGSAGGRWGLRVPGRLDLREVEGEAYVVRSEGLVDDSPFYARFPLRTATGHGWGERVRPGAIGRWWMRPLVGMRVVGPTRNSVWTALFIGPQEDRITRLLASWRG